MPKINLLFIPSLALLAISLFSSQPSLADNESAPSTVYLPMVSNPYPRVAGEPSIRIDNELVFFETFDGDPSSPQPWTDENWDLTIHQRDQDKLYIMKEMPAHHGPNCEPPPATHTITAFEDNLYICKNHMMTANYGESDNAGYGLVFFAPNQLIDTTDDFFIKFDMSTFRVNPARNWVDIWITPYDQNLQLAIHEFDPDLQGAPREGIQIRLQLENYFRTTIHENANETDLSINNYKQYHQVLEMSKTVRSTFYFGVADGRLKVGLPEYNLWWHDQPAPAIFSRPDWKEAVVQFGHHSYTPQKQCTMSFFEAECNQNGAETFHWDNLMLYPTKPFDLVQGTPRLITTSTAVKTFTPNQPAPPNSYLRFAGIGENLEVSFNSGATWQAAVEQAHSKTKQNNHFRSYWTSVPTGTTAVKFRGENWFGGQLEWAARDISFWSKGN
ncbi:MAG: hypothetical protein ACI9EW_002966 [Cellvibrionaceae bacterium]|jgi:hypothetical protein